MAQLKAMADKEQAQREAEWKALGAVIDEDRRQKVLHLFDSLSTLRIPQLPMQATAVDDTYRNHSLGLPYIIQREEH